MTTRNNVSTPTMGVSAAAPIDLSKSLDSARIVAAEGGIMSYIVQFRSDVSEKDRTEHIKKVTDLCDVYKPTGTSKQGVKIEAHLSKTMLGYVGVFTSEIKTKIAADAIVSGVTPNQAPEIYGDRTRNWGASFVSSNEATWDSRPSSDGTFPYVLGPQEKGGANTMIFLLDQGGFSAEDFKDPKRVTAVGNGGTGLSYDHATMMANIMAGDAMGMAPKAKLWVNNAAVLSKVAVLLALEAIASMDLSQQQIKAGASILCLPFGFTNTDPSKNPLSTALVSVTKSQNLKVVAAAPNSGSYVVNYTTWPQNFDDLILVGGCTNQQQRMPKSDSSSKISLYGPAMGIPMLTPKSKTDQKLAWGRYDLSSGTAWGNCFGAAHVCAVIALNLGDDEHPAPLNHEMKDILERRFSKVTAYETVQTQKLPIRIVKKFLQPVSPPATTTTASSTTAAVVRECPDEVPLDWIRSGVVIRQQVDGKYGVTVLCQELQTTQTLDKDTVMKIFQGVTSARFGVSGDKTDYGAMAKLLGLNTGQTQFLLATLEQLLYIPYKQAHGFGGVW